MNYNRIIKLPFKINKEFKYEIISKLFYIHTNIQKTLFLEKGTKIKIIFTKKISNYDFVLIKKNIIVIINKILKKPIIPNKIILYDKRKNKFTNTKNLKKKLIKDNEIFKEGDGYYSLGPKLTSLINNLDSKLILLANSVKASHYTFPSLMSSEFLNKTDYYQNFPQSCCFASHITENYDAINDFQVKDINLKKDQYTFKAALSPTVCQHLYFMLSNRKLKNNLIATARSNCFRYESKNMDSLERTWNFDMRELIIIGTEKYVLKKLNYLQKKIIKILDDFNISYFVESANDPFFQGNYNDLIAYQNAFKLKFEVRGETPYNKKSIAIGSFNNSQNFFGKKLNIKIINDYIHSACIGFGYERFAYCFVSQHGLDTNNWPKKIKFK